MCVCEHTAWHKHPLELDAPRCLQADRAIQKALREADEQLRKMQARASSHADTSQALSEAAAACCGRLPPEAAAEAFLGTCAQLDVLRALRDRASAAEQLSAAATRLVSPPLHLPCSPPAAPHLTRFGMPGFIGQNAFFSVSGALPVASCCHTGQGARCECPHKLCMACGRRLCSWSRIFAGLLLDSAMSCALNHMLP